MISPDVLNIPRCQLRISPMYSWYLPDVLMVSPDVLNTLRCIENPRCTERTLYISAAAVALTVPIICDQRHYLEIASALDFKNAATRRFGHSDVVCDLFIETSFSHLISLLFNFSKLLQLAFWVSLNQNNLTLCHKYHKFHLLSSFADD